MAWVRWSRSPRAACWAWPSRTSANSRNWVLFCSSAWRDSSANSPTSWRRTSSVADFRSSAAPRSCSSRVCSDGHLGPGRAEARRRGVRARRRAGPTVRADDRVQATGDDHPRRHDDAEHEADDEADDHEFSLLRGCTRPSVTPGCNGPGGPSQGTDCARQAGSVGVWCARAQTRRSAAGVRSEAPSGRDGPSPGNGAATATTARPAGAAPGLRPRRS